MRSGDVMVDSERTIGVETRALFGEMLTDQVMVVVGENRG